MHAGILADRRLPTHVAQLEELGVAPFDLVVSNLYPFTQTVMSGASPDECVEQIDIGGPSMVRAAAKNHPSVAIVTSPARYADVLAALGEGGFTLEQRKRLAAEAFVHTATYDVAVASWMGTRAHRHLRAAPASPPGSAATWDRAAVLRYGENPHQSAALYLDGFGPAGLAQAQQLHGKEMSYNNYVDADAARRAAYDFDEPAVAIIKHANPCGIAVGADVAEAHRKAHECDPVSAFGGVIAVNRPVSVEMAKQVAEVFTEVVVAPAYEDGAVEILPGQEERPAPGVRSRCAAAASRPGRSRGGLLMQQRDLRRRRGRRPVDAGRWRPGRPPPPRCSPTSRSPGGPAAPRSPTRSCWPRGGASVGIGMGQVNRVDSCRLAVDRAGSGRRVRSRPRTRSSPSRTARRS